ncbi:hypothetical protein BC937DRAFT_95265 [Endogone sp. FLAS-F59071]|nr:hypothetical protein BC937DRAFT_95265 [Endogone sp. FLAS-F59071]|eukprot:RUS20427.1 hypothetical protein BC937DRAFT_95265 [Endogone sp. FLAS-F59071]
MQSLVGPLLDPHFESMACTILMTASLLFVLAIIFFSFLSVRIDGIVHWSFSIVFIPLWIVDAVLVGLVSISFAQLLQNNPDDDQDELDEDGDQEDENITDDERRARRQARRTERKRWSHIRRVTNLLYVSSAVLFQIFVVLRIDGRVTWPAAVIFIPYFVLEVINLFPNIINYIVALRRIQAVADGERLTLSVRLYMFFTMFWWFAIRVAQAVLLILRLDGIIMCSWAIVFLPLYLIGLKYAIQLLLAYRAFSKIPEYDAAVQGKISVGLGAMAFIILGTLFYTLIGLVAKKLDGNNFVRMSSVLIPVFLVLVRMTCKE